MSSEISQADLIRVDIEKRLAEKFDFSKASNKLIAVKELIESNQLDTTPAKLQKAYYPILKEYAKKQGVEVASKKKQVLKVNPQMISGDMDSTINPVPQTVSQPQLMNSPQVNPNDPNATNVTPMLVNHDIEGVSASINAFYLVVKTAFAPEAELLSDEEKKSLGSIWLPIFNKYLQNEKSVLLVAIASSIGIVSPKLSKGRKLKKAKQPKKETKEQKEEKALDVQSEEKPRDGFQE